MNATPFRMTSRGRSRIPLLRQVTIKVQKVGGINLGQGTCQLPVPRKVLDAAAAAMNEGHNRYTYAQGTLEARRAVAEKLARHNGFTANPETEVMITPGVTGAFEAICCTMIDPGDEVVCFEPYYPYHHNALTRAGARITYIPLEGPAWEFSLPALEAALARKPKFLLINTPANPNGKVFTEAELRAIGNATERHGVLVVTDEMYEYMVFDGRKHISPASLPEFAGRTVTMGGYSKTFAITGWRLGYAVAPAEIASAMTRVIDELYICAPSPSQSAVTRALAELDDSFYEEIAVTYAKKRDFFCAALESAGFEVARPQGAYYAVANFARNFGELPSEEFVDRMIELVQVGGVPSGDFVLEPSNAHWVRFCFAVDDAILDAAAEKLAQLSVRWPARRMHDAA